MCERDCVADSEQGFKTLLTPTPDRTLLSGGLDVLECCPLFPRRNMKWCPAMENLKKQVFSQRTSRGIGLSLRYSTPINMTQNQTLLVTLGKQRVSSHCWSAFLDLSYTPASCITDEMDPVVPDGLRAPLSAHTFQLHQAETSLHRLHWLAVKSICLLNNMVNSTTCSTQ